MLTNFIAFLICLCCNCDIRFRIFWLQIVGIYVYVNDLGYWFLAVAIF